MKYILSNDDKFSLEIEADIKRKIKGYVIVSKKETINEFIEKDIHDLYELNESEMNFSFESETIPSFCEKYIIEPLLPNQKVTNVSIYHEGETIHEIGLPITVLIFEPNKPAYEKEVPYTRKSFSDIVNGHPEYVTLSEDLVLICNEEGMLINLPQHRGFYGTFLVAGLVNGWSASLTKEQIKKVKTVLDKKENFESKSKYLKEYFQTHDIPRKVFFYEFDNISSHIGTESIIEFLLSQESKEQLQMIELEIRDIERNQKDIYPYLKSVGYQMAKRQNKRF
ncbi:hypothetical protein CVD28_01400 [Bacillus sp. M6-12]|uniref:DUF3846 domain-containing protein n=1 Tax=Bacillus sp. M6-12 TaxID=2054166 RepID=UPI000C76756D|nr:DUF3846 domain-containing protein [Bacillus sp. M6-12]PLS19090.1 hypothetical protein CVD28_01400 [Bacillus sp. M6-12]